MTFGLRPIVNSIGVLAHRRFAEWKGRCGIFYCLLIGVCSISFCLIDLQPEGIVRVWATNENSYVEALGVTAYDLWRAVTFIVIDRFTTQTS